MYACIMRCSYMKCHKKVNTFSNTECLCGMYFCSLHRLPYQHECIKLENIKEKHKTDISNSNPVVKQDKWNLSF